MLVAIRALRFMIEGTRAPRSREKAGLGLDETLTVQNVLCSGSIAPSRPGLGRPLCLIAAPRNKTLTEAPPAAILVSRSRRLPLPGFPLRAGKKSIGMDNPA